MRIYVWATIAVILFAMLFYFTGFRRSVITGEERKAVLKSLWPSGNESLLSGEEVRSALDSLTAPMPDSVYTDKERGIVLKSLKP